MRPCHVPVRYGYPIRGWWDAWLDAADRLSVDGHNSFIASWAVKRAGVPVAFSGLGSGVAALSDFFPDRYRPRHGGLAESNGHAAEQSAERDQFPPASELVRLGLQAGDLGLRPDYIADVAHVEWEIDADDPFVIVS
jgi:hypothetical protein